MYQKIINVHLGLMIEGQKYVALSGKVSECGYAGNYTKGFLDRDDLLVFQFFLNKTT